MRDPGTGRAPRNAGGGETPALPSQFRVFVSYSRRDLALVAPVVALLRATRDWVFHDVDTIRPGKRWRSELERALDSAQLVVVFWCEHAASSENVREEYVRAMGDGKDVLPLLVDSTPLPSALAEYQYLDFTALAGGMHAAASPPPAAPRNRAPAPPAPPPSVPSPAPAAPAPPKRAPARRGLLLTLLGGGTLALAALLWLLPMQGARSPAGPDPSSGYPAPAARPADTSVVPDTAALPPAGAPDTAAGAPDTVGPPPVGAPEEGLRDGIRLSAALLLLGVVGLAALLLVAARRLAHRDGRRPATPPASAPPEAHEIAAALAEALDRKRREAFRDEVG